MLGKEKEKRIKFRHPFSCLFFLTGPKHVHREGDSPELFLCLSPSRRFLLLAYLAFFRLAGGTPKI